MPRVLRFFRFFRRKTFFAAPKYGILLLMCPFAPDAAAEGKTLWERIER